jgi:putative membrane protein
MNATSYSNLPRTLLALYLLIWLALAVQPKYREDWVLENLLVLVAIPLLIANYRRLRFSNAAYTCLFVFFCVHAVGAYYTYSEVPYDDWARALTGRSLDSAFGWQRNHYDRVVHFAYGLLLAPAVVELLDRRAPQQGMWRWLLPVLFLASHSVIYEVIEMTAALIFGGDLGVAYLGTQGDEWDSQKDMALALGGAVISVAWVRFARAHGPAQSLSHQARNSANPTRPSRLASISRKPAATALSCWFLSSESIRPRNSVRLIWPSRSSSAWSNSSSISSTRFCACFISISCQAP